MGAASSTTRSFPPGRHGAAAAEVSFQKESSSAVTDYEVDESFHNAVENLPAEQNEAPLDLHDVIDNNDNTNIMRMGGMRMGNHQNGEDEDDRDSDDDEDVPSDLEEDLMELAAHRRELMMMDFQEVHFRRPFRPDRRTLRADRREMARLLQQRRRNILAFRERVEIVDDRRHHRIRFPMEAANAPRRVAFGEVDSSGMPRRPPEDPRVTHKRLLERGTEAWHNVPRDLRQDESFARSIQEFTPPLLRAILRTHPALAKDREYWRQIFPLTCGMKALVADLFTEYADESLFQDDQLMKEACKFSPRFQLMLQDGKREKSRYFWKSLIDDDPLVLGTLPHSVQRRFPDLVDETLPVLGRMPWPERDMYLIYRVAPNIVPEFWRHRENLRKWFTSGLPLYAHDIPGVIHLVSDLKNDKEVFRWIAQHCRSSLKVASFYLASVELRSDKEFMLECVALDPRILKCAVEPLRKDFDLVLTACAGPRELVAMYLEETRFLVGQAKFIPRFHARIRNMHRSNQSFHPVGLQCMTSCSGSALAMLNDENVKKVIAIDFLDASTKMSQIELVALAASNLDAIRGVPT